MISKNLVPVWHNKLYLKIFLQMDDLCWDGHRYWLLHVYTYLCEGCGFSSHSFLVARWSCDYHNKDFVRINFTFQYPSVCVHVFLIWTPLGPYPSGLINRVSANLHYYAYIKMFYIIITTIVSNWTVAVFSVCEWSTFPISNVKKEGQSLPAAEVSEDPVPVTLDEIRQSERRVERRLKQLE